MTHLLEDYRHLHANPELSHREYQTAARLAEEFRSLGLTVTEGIGGTGVAAVLAGDVLTLTPAVGFLGDVTITVTATVAARPTASAAHPAGQHMVLGLEALRSMTYRSVSRTARTGMPSSASACLSWKPASWRPCSTARITSFSSGVAKLRVCN